MIVAAVGLYVLQFGAEWLVEGATGIAYRIGMPAVIVGATIVSLGTTTPECAVSVMAAFQGEAGLALGNAVGSVIVDSALIFGLCCLLTRLPADKFLLSRQGWVQFGSGVLLAVICYYCWFIDPLHAQIPRVVGILLVTLLAIYLYFSVIWANQHPTKSESFTISPHLAEQAKAGEVFHVDDQHARKLSYPVLFGMLLAGLILVVGSGHFVIESVNQLALRVGIPQIVLASTLVALGTSLPEFVVGITAVRKGHPELLVGNIIGADVLNILFVTGFALLASPLPLIEPTAKVPAIFMYVHLPSMLIILAYFRLIIFKASRQGHFERWMGIPFLLMYVAYVVIQYLISA